MYLGFSGQPNLRYQNDAALSGRRRTAASLKPRNSSAAWGDYDADGDPDLLLGFAPGTASVLKLYRNDAGRFSDVTQASGLTRTDSAGVRQFVWLDIDADGDLDLFVALRDRPNAMYRNDAGRFSNVAAEMGLADTRKSVGAVWFDFDEDGDLDVATRTATQCSHAQ